ncbi:MAG: phosphoadenylyl-sulfate reductase [Flavobacteriaceae bacterium]|nr:phosphoadenylyl-sulfate reductase [Bacteroidia bacterium]NNK83841.1 phosphoadenylyl-sulfate reductase [Flavobacteriaceae bacterium]
MSKNESLVKKRLLSPKEIKALNEKYNTLSPSQRIKQFYKDFKAEEIMVTSSFAATSALLLKFFSDVNPKQKIYFIDTGFHFKETINYKKELKRLYNLNVESISALKEEHKFTIEDKTWQKNPDFCCYVNKVKPLELIKQNYTVWVSGLMKWQSDHRSSLDIFEMRNNMLKFYPLLDITKKERQDIIVKEQLPFHPLVFKGFNSIGCKHCTVPGDDRNGRWNNNPKTECGLHL